MPSRVGECHAFKKDPKLNPDFPRLYRQWIHNLCAPEGKGQTLVCRTGEQLNGMVALDQDDAVAQVVLVAVAEGSRGQGLGKRLMQGAEHWGYIQGLKRMQVVTQQENIAALRLYEKSGYAVTNRSYIYPLLEMKQYQIPFNKPYFSGNETKYIEDAVRRGKISGNGYYTQKCQAFFEERYGFLKTFMTTSCTHALEMAAMLMDIQPGDEVIMPTYTFVSSALPFVSRGAHIVFADSSNENPNLDVSSLKALISKRTKAILVVHYGGVACEMDEVMSLAESHQLFVVEDAAHAIDSSYKGRPLGSIGHFGAFSFHETKNVISGEGGMLCVNEKGFYCTC